MLDPPGKHVRRGLALFHELHTHVVGLASEEDRIDRLPEFAHSVIAFGRWTVKPINGAVFARDESIGAGGDVDDNLSFSHGSGYNAVRFAGHIPNTIFLSQ